MIVVSFSEKFYTLLAKMLVSQSANGKGVHPVAAQLPSLVPRVQELLLPGCIHTNLCSMGKLG